MLNSELRSVSHQETASKIEGLGGQLRGLSEKGWIDSRVLLSGSEAEGIRGGVLSLVNKINSEVKSGNDDKVQAEMPHFVRLLDELWHEAGNAFKIIDGEWVTGGKGNFWQRITGQAEQLRQASREGALVLSAVLDLYHNQRQRPDQEVPPTNPDVARPTQESVFSCLRYFQEEGLITEPGKNLDNAQIFRLAMAQLVGKLRWLALAEIQSHRPWMDQLLNELWFQAGQAPRIKNERIVGAKKQGIFDRIFNNEVASAQKAAREFALSLSAALSMLDSLTKSS